jgi:hypothetical protein
VVSVADEEDADWLEKGSGKTALNHFALPVAPLVVDS